jgi:hypothetical protein
MNNPRPHNPRFKVSGLLEEYSVLQPQPNYISGIEFVPGETLLVDIDVFQFSCKIHIQIVI